MTTFHGICLLVFAGWIAIGIVSSIGRMRPSAVTLIALLFAAFVVYVLTASALELNPS
ncbi:MAG TPA: hypothetical protein VN969_32525 [Streptosporangiaceae bacterium]|nr:hypothetical protein [Streptosporangiaceae bacterium]